jgi:hypothetical protein
MSDIQLAQLNAELNIFEEMNALGYDSRITEFLNNYDDIVLQVHQQATQRGLAGIVGVTASDLEILATNNEIFMLDKGRLYASQFKSALLNSLINGQSIDETLSTLRGTPFTDAQLRTGVTQGITRFESSAIAKVFDESPEQKFRLEGPIDAVIRASCHAVMVNQPKDGWTKKEIDGGSATKLALENMQQFEHSPSEVKTVMGGDIMRLIKNIYYKIKCWHYKRKLRNNWIAIQKEADKLLDEFVDKLLTELIKSLRS